MGRNRYKGKIIGRCFMCEGPIHGPSMSMVEVDGEEKPFHPQCARRWYSLDEESEAKRTEALSQKRDDLFA